MGKFTKEIEKLEASLQKDQIYIARGILAGLDEVADTDSEVKDYYSNNAAVLDELRGDIAYAEELLGLLKSDDAWTQCASTKDGSKAFFKKDEDSPFLMTKIETILRCEISEIPEYFVRAASLFNEVDLMPKWFPMGLMKMHELLHEKTNFSKVTRFTVKMPFPIGAVIGARECVSLAKGFDMCESMECVVATQPLNAGMSFDSFESPPPEAGFTRMLLKSAIYFVVTSEGLGFKQIQLLDLKSKLIPSTVVNWLTKGELPLRILKDIRKRVYKFEGSEWEKRTKEDNSNLYVDIEKRMAISIQEEYGVTAPILEK